MFKKYGFNTQKGKVIRIMLQKADKWYEDFECEKLHRWFGEDIYVGNNSGARLSQLKKDGVVEVEYFENPAINPKTGLHCYKRARYRLTPKAVEFYEILYLLN